MMRIVYMGTPEFAVAPLKGLLEMGETVVGVFTQQDKPQGRGMKMAPPPVKKAALEHDLPVFQPRSFKTEEAFQQLKDLEPDLVVVTAYGQILPKRVLELPQYGCVNVHASLLPDYRGASPIQQVILRGETKTGVTIMQMDRGLDTGDILLMREIPIEPRETADSLHDKLALLGKETLCLFMEKLKKGEITPEPQPKECRFYAPLIKKQDGQIHFTESAVTIDRMARGLTPWPGIFTTFQGRTIKLFGIQVKEGAGGEPGAILSCSPEGLTVACPDGQVVIAQLQAPGGKRMACVDYFRGHPYNKDDRFE